MKEREKFSSRLGFILVSAGCAVGLGNVWKFPYICGINGGATFILIYLLFLVILGYPILTCEFTVGRASQRGPAACYNELEPEGTSWHHFRWIAIFGNYLLMMFYTMVGGWMLYYAFQMATGSLAGLDAGQIEGFFSDMLSSPSTMVLWMIITVVISFSVCSLGLQNGVEKITKVMMSLLIVLIVVLAVHSITLKNASEGLSFYLIPNLDVVHARGWGTVIFDAMTHAFFTLSIGIGSMEIFGSYLNRDRTIATETKSVVILDTFVALMAGFIILPACFAFGVEPDKGPALLFITLPNVFNHMSLGQLWGTSFFIFMSFAALSTIIAVFENIISFFIDLLNWSRKKAVAVNIVLVIILSLPCIFGFNILSNLQPLGVGTNIMDLEDFFVSYNLLPLGAMIFVLFCTCKNSWGWKNFLKEANTGKGTKVSDKLQFYMHYILPAIIIIVYLKGYYDLFLPQGIYALVGWFIFAFALLGFIFYVIFHKKKSV